MSAGTPEPQETKATHTDSQLSKLAGTLQHYRNWASQIQARYQLFNPDAARPARRIYVGGLSPETTDVSKCHGALSRIADLYYSTDCPLPTPVASWHQLQASSKHCHIGCYVDQSEASLTSLIPQQRPARLHRTHVQLHFARRGNSIRRPAT